VIAIVFCAMVFIASAVIQFQFFAPGAASISYSEFKGLVKGQGREPHLGRDTISGTLSADGLGPARSVEDPKRSGSGMHPFVTARGGPAGDRLGRPT
jgi:hypothetical protein